MKNHMQNLAERLIAEQEEKELFVSSQEFLDIVTRIREYLVDHEVVSEERMKEVPGLSYDQVKKAMEAVYATQPMIKEQDANYPHYYVDFHDCRFHLMIGQGSVYWITNI